jgi:hypothetical protein
VVFIFRSHFLNLWINIHETPYFVPHLLSLRIHPLTTIQMMQVSINCSFSFTIIENFSARPFRQSCMTKEVDSPIPMVSQNGFLMEHAVYMKDENGDKSRVSHFGVFLGGGRGKDPK